MSAESSVASTANSVEATAKGNMSAESSAEATAKEIIVTAKVFASTEREIISATIEMTTAENKAKYYSNCGVMMSISFKPTFFETKNTWINV